MMDPVLKCPDEAALVQLLAFLWLFDDSPVSLADGTWCRAHVEGAKMHRVSHMI